MSLFSCLKFMIPVIALLIGMPAFAQSVWLNPSSGYNIGLVFETFMSPHQESGEEEDTPESTPDMFKSTAPSLTRDQREANGHRGHGVIRFTKDLSRAYIDIKIQGVNIDDITMFHIHCGKPGILGPILVDFALITDIQQNFRDDGIFSVVVTNDAIAQTAAQGDESLVAAFTRGCVILAPAPEMDGSPLPLNKVATVAGMADIAMEGDIYFNLHTAGQQYFGDIRGQWYLKDK